MAYNRWLAHHGVLGQKWGERHGPPYPLGRKISDGHRLLKTQSPNFKTKSGTLNAKGVKRLDTIYKSYNPPIDTNRKERTQRISDKGVVKRRGYDVIRKNSIVTRFSDKELEQPSRKSAYVSLTDWDADTYREWGKLGQLGFKKSSVYFEHQSKTTKDLKVARGEDVLDHIIKTYGDKTIEKKYLQFKELDRKYPGFGDTYSYHLDKKSPTYKDDLKVITICGKGQGAIYSFVKDKMYRDITARDKIYDHYISEGYDAIVDVEDWNGLIGFTGTDYPLVILNPEDKLQAYKTYRRET